MMTRKLAAVFVCVAFSSDLFAQSGAVPASATRMDQVARYFVDTGQFMGSVLVTRAGKTIFSKSYGFANLEWQIPNTPSTRFRIGSITKQFTAAAILLLEERGKLSIMDPISKYYPEAPTAWEKVTLEHLLTHRSGIPNYTATPDFAKFSATHAAPNDLIKLVRDKPLDFVPGTEMRYSNSGYVLLGIAIEKASENSYAKFLKEDLLDPIGMKDSGYDDNAAVLPQRASGYSMRPDGPVNANYTDMSTPFAAGAMYSTVEDLARWERALFGKKVLSELSLKKMTGNGKEGYAFGLMVDRNFGRTEIGHGGGISGFSSALAYYPEDEVIVVALSNLDAPGAGNVMEKLAAVAHGVPVELPSERKVISVSRNILETYVGSYQLKPGFNLDITLEGNQLISQATGQKKHPLVAETETRFYPTDFEARLEFRKDAAGKVISVVLHQNGNDTTAPRLK